MQRTASMVSPAARIKAGRLKELPLSSFPLPTSPPSSSRAQSSFPSYHCQSPPGLPPCRPCTGYSPQKRTFPPIPMANVYSPERPAARPPKEVRYPCSSQNVEVATNRADGSESRAAFRLLDRPNSCCFSRPASLRNDLPIIMTAPSQPASSSSSTPFDIVASYRHHLKSELLPPPIAAINALIELLSHPSTSLSTVSELIELISNHSSQLKAALPNPIPATAGTDLFARFVVALDWREDERASGNSFQGNLDRLIRVATEYCDKTVPDCRARICQRANVFIKEGSVSTPQATVERWRTDLTLPSFDLLLTSGHLDSLIFASHHGGPSNSSSSTQQLDFRLRHRISPVWSRSQDSS